MGKIGSTYCLDDGSTERHNLHSHSTRVGVLVLSSLEVRESCSICGKTEEPECSRNETQLDHLDRRQYLDGAN